MTVGETLSCARRKRKLSVEDVAADTRIRATLIVAIEADQYALCGGAVYARGHIRSIARVVGVDPAPLIEEFDTAHRVERPVAVASMAADHATDYSVVARSERRGPNWSVAAAMALVVICAIAIVGLVHSHSTPGSARTGEPAGPTTGQAQPPSSTSTAPPPVATNAAATRATMLVRARHGRTWLEITSKSGHKLFRGFLDTGQHRSFSARGGLEYVIGNAPAVDVVVNGNDIGAPRSPSVVAQGNVVPGKGTLHQT